jgi:predicted glycoside hydrolase/deacetylase ChbG (UPF0249 family)
MKIQLPPKMMNDLTETVRTAFTQKGIVNILRLAEEIRMRNEAANVALEDITAEVMAQAQRFNAAMEFDGPHLN